MRAPTLALLALAVALGGCHPAPTISQISESSLSIDQGLGTTMAQVRAEAERGCGVYGRTPALVSSRCRGAACVTSTYLYACRRPGENGSTSSTARPGADLLAAPAAAPPAQQEPPAPAAAPPAPTGARALLPSTPATPLGGSSRPTATAGSGAGTDPCAPYAADPVQRLRCSWVTGPDRDRYVPSVGRDASLRTQMNCIPDRDDPARYAACVARGS
jgi:hypothetical protein